MQIDRWLQRRWTHSSARMPILGKSALGGYIRDCRDNERIELYLSE